MGKLYLLFILSLVSVFSASAQMRDRVTSTATDLRPRYVDNFDMTSGVKVYVPAAARPAPETADVAETKASRASASSAANLKVKKTQLIQLTNSSSATTKNGALGAFSTGNSVFDGYILAACARYDIDPLLIYAQMNQESAFKLKATSYKGASGLMQLMPATAMRFGVTSIYDPKQNIEAGVRYMRWLLNKFGGDVRLALAGYNAGEGAVMKYGNQIPPYRETQNYVARITARYNQIKMTTPAAALLASSNNATH